MSAAHNLNCLFSDGTAPVLRFFEIDGYRMLSDHLTSSYYASIEALAPENADESPNDLERAQEALLQAATEGVVVFGNRTFETNEDDVYTLIGETTPATN